MRQAIGVAVLTGLVGVTLFGLALTPLSYYVLRSRSTYRRSAADRPQPEGALHA